MATTLIDFCSFVTGSAVGGGELVLIKNGTIVSTQKWTDKETYSMEVINAAQTRLQSKPATTGTYINFGVIWRHLATLGTGDNQIIQVNATTPHLRIATTSAGALKVLDAAGTVVATSADGLIVADVDNFLEVKFKWADSGDCRVWLNRNRLFTLTAQDFKNGTANADLNLRNDITADPTGQKIRYASFYFLTDDGPTIDDNLSRGLGRFYSLGPYKSATTTAAGDFGDPLDAGTWGNVQETPGDDANIGSWTTPAGVSEAGGISTDHATQNVGGPKDDTRLTGSIIGAKWIWRYKAELTGFFGDKPSFAPKYGKCVPLDVNLDKTTTGASVLGDGTFVNTYIVLPDSDAAVPTKNDYFQIGFKSDGSLAEAPGTVTLADCWMSLLVHDQRYHIHDGQVVMVQAAG